MFICSTNAKHYISRSWPDGTAVRCPQRSFAALQQVPEALRSLTTAHPKPADRTAGSERSSRRARPRDGHAVYLLYRLENQW